MRLCRTKYNSSADGKLDSDIICHDTSWAPGEVYSAHYHDAAGIDSTALNDSVYGRFVDIMASQTKRIFSRAP
jgi:hypothetical protein